MRKTLIALLIPAVLVPGLSIGATRLKELVNLEGVRDNQLMGYGLVVGLN
jgi:flagellar P-ring protein precursor FlgI